MESRHQVINDLRNLIHTRNDAIACFQLVRAVFFKMGQESLFADRSTDVDGHPHEEGKAVQKCIGISKFEKSDTEKSNFKKGGRMSDEGVRTFCLN